MPKETHWQLGSLPGANAKHFHLLPLVVGARIELLIYENNVLHKAVNE